MTKPRLLVWDEDASISRMLEDILVAWGYQPIVVGSDLRFVDEVRKNRPDLMIISLGRHYYTGYTGLEILELVRREPDLADIPAILMDTDHGALDSITDRKCGELRIVARFHMPFELKDLLAAVAMALKAQ